MTITAHDIITTTTCPTFIEALYQFLRPIEGDISFVYRDSKGIPTLGIGYALIVYDGKKWVLRPDYPAHLTAATNLTQPQLDDLRAKLIQAMKSLNGDTTATNPFFPAATGNNPLGWVIDSTQSRALFDNVVPEYEMRVKNWLGSANAGIYNGLLGSKEMVALVSLAYNGIINGGKSQNLKEAILAGDRAAAWFEIRYNSNLLARKMLNGLSLTADEQAAIARGEDSGLASRRYKEADVFGLYDNTAPSIVESKQVYRMFTNNHDYILKYELGYSTVGQIDPLTGASVGSVGDNLRLACVTIMGGLAGNTNTDIALAWQKWVGAGNDPLNFDPTKMFLGDSSRGAAVDARQYVPLSGPYINPGEEIASNDIVLAGDGGVFGTTGYMLLGGLGNDLIIGDTGNDVLWGGGGNDIMAGGGGNDTYILDGGGADTIEDKDGNNRVLLNGKVLCNFTTSDGINYVSYDGVFTATMQPNGDFIVYDGNGNQVTLNQNFQSGDFGITLKNAPQTDRTITGDLTPIVYGYDSQGNPIYHYDDLGNLITSGETSVQDDILNGSAGNDLITGGLGSDIFTGNDGDDKIFADYQSTTAAAIANGNMQDGLGVRGDWLAGGSGDDTLVGDRANDVLSGGAGRDLLIGGAGDDELMGDSDYVPLNNTWTVTGENPRMFQPLHPMSVEQPAGGAADTLYGGKTYVSTDAAGNKHTYTVLAGDINTAGGATLLIDGTIEIFNYRAGDLGLTLGNAANDAAFVVQRKVA